MTVTIFDTFDLIANVESTFQDVLVGIEGGVHEPPGVAMRVQFRTNGAQTLVEQEKTGHLKKGIFTVCTQLKNEDLVARSLVPAPSSFREEFTQPF